MKNANLYKSFFLFLFFLSPFFPALAEENIELAKFVKEVEAEKFASLYTLDLRARIGQEKYDTIKPLSEKFSLRQSGSLKNETAYRITHPTEFTKIRNQLILSEAGKFSDNLRFKVSGRAYYDAVFALTHNFPSNVRSDMQSEVELRDTYMDYSKGPWDIRIGKQQVVWGEAIALFFADTVNAKDLREFILPDFDMIRIPQWGVDLEYSKNNFHAEFVWMPVPEMNKLGVTNSEFAFPLPLPSSGTPFTYFDPSKPKTSLNNSEAGLRLSYLLNGWDFSAFYLHTWNKSPVNFRSISAGVYEFSPAYKKLDIFGATFAKEINEIVLKGEFVYNKDDYFQTYDSSVENGVLRRSWLNYLLGVDYTFFGKIDTAFQFMQKVIFNYSNLLTNEYNVNNSIALWLKTGFFNGALEPELTVVSSLMTQDLMIRPRINYKFMNNWLLRFGADIFQGKDTGTFGMFNKKSRLYSELSYNF